jgi:hypothetical protein
MALGQVKAPAGAFPSKSAAPCRERHAREAQAERPITTHVDLIVSPPRKRLGKLSILSLLFTLQALSPTRSCDPVA